MFLFIMNRIRCDIWSRVCGYLRPTDHWNQGKAEEFGDRKEFKLS